MPSISVRRMALHGRFPYLSYPRRYRREDHEAVEAALRRADALELAERPMPELSGGQRQRAYLAMALAQGAETVLMDEPTAFLDIRHQLGVMDTARALAAEGRAVAIGDARPRPCAPSRGRARRHGGRSGSGCWTRRRPFLKAAS